MKHRLWESLPMDEKRFPGFSSMDETFTQILGWISVVDEHKVDEP
jgi:hypothetical protein